MTSSTFKGLLSGIGSVIATGLSVLGGVEIIKKISKRQKSTQNRLHHLENPAQSASVEASVKSYATSKNDNDQLSAFPLNNIQSLFYRYRVTASDAGAFQKLLFQIERISYNDILKKVLDSGQAPATLYECVQNITAEEYRIDNYSFDSGPYVDGAIIDSLLKKCNSDSLVDRPLPDKVEFLVNYSLNKGYNRFNNLFGDHLQEFKRCFELGMEDKYIPLYNSIIEGIRTSYNINNL